MKGIVGGGHRRRSVSAVWSIAPCSAVSTLTVVMALIAGCRSAVPPPLPTVPSPPPAAVTLPDSLHWVRNSAEYRAAVLQAFRLATARVEEAARGRAAGSWAVVSDADETLLDNSQYQKERAAAGLPFTPESWTEWVRRREASAVPGAVDFARHVRALGGRLAVVTNRTQAECADSEANLRSLGLDHDAILCRPAGAPSDKGPRFRQVESGQAFASLPVDVVLFVGDNILDFPGLDQQARGSAERLAAFGVRFVVIPNPMYGSWEGNPRQ
jgi:5'-nucleotidase (lipoprotein e(P4) family)